MHKITLLFFTYLFTLLLACNPDNELDYKILRGRTFNLSPGSDAFYCDLNNDAESELIIIETGDDVRYRIRINDYTSDFHISSMPLFAKYMDCNFFDVSGNKNKEVIYTYQSHDSLFLKIYQPYNEEKVILDELLAVGHKHPDHDKDWDGSLTIQAFQDLNHDGNVDILLVAAAGYPLYPRAVIAFDVFNRQKLWQYNLGPMLERAYIKDINNDGKYEIYVNNWSPDNGAKRNGTDDHHSYFIVLDEGGNLIQQKEMGGINSSTAFLFTDFGHSRDEIITVTKNSNIKNTDDYQIAKWEWDNKGEILPVKINKSFRTIEYLISPYRGIKTLFISDWEKNVIVFDSNLKKIKSVKLQNAISWFKGYADLNNDGSHEIICNTFGDSALILNDNLELIAISDPVKKVMPIEKGRRMSKGFAFLNSKNQLYEVFLKKRTLFDSIYENKLTVLNILLFLVILISWIWFLISRGNWKWYSKQLKYFNDAQTAVMLLDKHARIQSCNTSMEKLLAIKSKVKNMSGIEIFTTHSHFKTIGIWLDDNIRKQNDCSEHFKIANDHIEHSLHVQLHFIFSRMKRLESILIRINDLTPIVQSQRTSAWITVAQKLAHELKNPLTTIQLSLQRMRMEYDDVPGLKENLSEFIENGLDEVNRLRIVIDDFMHFSKIESSHPRTFKITDIINDIVARYRLNLPAEIEIKTFIEENLPALKADPSHLSTLFTNLLDNAIHATRKGEINIKVIYHEKVKDVPDEFLAKSIEIEITDTGHGMDSDTLKKIEHPFFTTKEGGSGLGISIVRKIIDDHHGEFEIFSKKGFGTRVTVRLPLNNDQN